MSRFQPQSFPSFADAHWHLLNDAASERNVITTRGRAHHELRHVSLAVTDPRTCFYHLGSRRHRHVIGILEGLQLVGQTSAPDIMTRKVPPFASFLDDHVFHGAYGTRIAGTVTDVAQLLAHQPSTRQAVLTIYDGQRDLLRAKKDVPCTLSLQFLLRDGALHLRVSMRSNDLWLGFPYDVIQFVMLQSALAAHLAVEMGEYVHLVGSAHLYEDDLLKAIKAVETSANDEHRDAVDFSELWPIGQSIEETVAQAQRILHGEPIEARNHFERFLATQVEMAG